jgi:uncharacterized protein YecE (DUF72 family)
VKKKGQTYIGTSGWNYKHWLGTFYPAGTKAAGQLPYYVSLMDTVELNNSFYHLPDRDTFKNWKAHTPDNFIFAVKASRYITHMKKLKDPKEPLKILIQNSRGLGKKLGPVLFQMPPGWKINYERLEAFIKALPRKLRFTFEFRNITWYDDRVYDLLQRNNCAFCMYELNGHQSPQVVTADFVYVRLHGPGAKYQGSYTDSTLKTWATQIKSWQRAGKDVYIYFDNDQAGYAAFNAVRLKELLT